MDELKVDHHGRLYRGTTKPPIELKVENAEEDHFILTFFAPGRVEVSLIRDPHGGKDRIIAHAYEGTAIDLDQDPAIAFDGTEVMA